MKKRICFVGFADEQLSVLKSLDTMSGVKETWQCTFAATANKALKEMAVEPFDVVVANMQLNGMNGAELLQQVGQKYPKTLRFILGDVADQELIMNCIGGTHQFIAGPCQPGVLISVVQRSLALDAWLTTDEIRKLTPRLQRLPSLPSTYFEVLKQVESPRSSVQNIGEVISRDPAVTARLLQVVNSAAFALHQKVTDATDAVGLLGVEMVKSLILCLQVFSQNDDAKKAGISFDQIWDHSLQVAKMAREITLMEARDARLANEAFTAGLLHDVGRIVLASNLPADYATVVADARQNKKPLLQAEFEKFGATHAHVGAYLLGLWGMPAQVVEAAALHHTPSHSFTPEFSLLTAVHAADVFAHENETRDDGIPKPTLDETHLKMLKIEDKPDIWRRTLRGEEVEPEPAPAKLPTMAVSPEMVESQPLPAAPAPAPARATAAAAPRGGLGIGWLAIPATAIVAVAAFWFYLQGSGSNNALPVQARTPAPTPPAATDVKPQAQVVAVTTTLATNEPAAPTTPTVTTASTNAAPITAAPGDQHGVTPETNAPVAPGPTTPFDAVKLQAVFFRTANPVALINGKTLGVGDHVLGLTVVAIEKNTVTLASGDEQRTFKLK